MRETINQFKKIIVGVDLSDGDRFVGRQLSTASAEAIQRAEQLARSHSAELLFFYVLPTSAMQLSFDRQILMAEGEVHKSVFDHANEVLAGLAESAMQRSIKAAGKVVFGTDWVEIIREVIRGDVDLVIAGTRNQGAFQSMIFGSSGIRLLRKCPCPVWITKPPLDGNQRVDSILVAHDLTDVGDSALEYGCSMAGSLDAKLHVLHTIEYQNPASDTIETGKKQEVESRIREQLKRLHFDSGSSVVQVDIGFAEDSILSYITRHDIPLIVMGTIARAGINGVLVGNTAEKLLPFLPCSVLAIKPADFRSPIALSSDELESELASG